VGGSNQRDRRTTSGIEKRKKRAKGAFRQNWGGKKKKGKEKALCVKGRGWGGKKKKHSEETHRREEKGLGGRLCTRGEDIGSASSGGEADDRTF